MTQLSRLAMFENKTVFSLLLDCNLSGLVVNVMESH